MRVPFSPHPHQQLVSLAFLTLAILPEVRGCLIMVLVCISLMMSDAEHFSGVFWPLNVFLGDRSVYVFCPFLNWIIWGFFRVEFFGVSCVSIFIQTASSKESSL